jgi:hypothetical protein
MDDRSSMAVYHHATMGGMEHARKGYNMRFVRFFGVFTALVLSVGAIGCGKGAMACAVVDAASKACTVVRYMGPDGKVDEVEVTPDEVNAFGRAAAARRKAEKPPCEVSGGCADSEGDKVSP